MNHMQKLRTIDKAYDEIKARDPDTCLSRHMLRAMVNDGTIPSIKSGVRALIDLNVVEQIFKDMTTIKEGKVS